MSSQSKQKVQLSTSGTKKNYKKNITTPNYKKEENIVKKQQDLYESCPWSKFAYGED